ncbi:MAG TPA: DUF3857 domain-containing protein [Thermoanaerobaculia bacterium]|nr:DUF3857 domain-containing protein [Thermoanaerobaculia bacterium]HUM30725.1 DUF3857 domain-containing protein [Thermoanaerobaculia bacterium]HXK68986.1 DUF3857 domain-containing protein [Thermoanaerobaculia bacterium]
MKSILVSFILFLCLFAFGAPPAEPDATLHDSRISLNMTPDGRVQETQVLHRTLHTYEAMDKEGDPRFLYRSDVQTFAQLEAETRMTSGKIVPTHARGLNGSTPYRLVACPPCTAWQEMVVTFLGLEPGAETTLSVKLNDVKPWRYALDGVLSFDGFSEVRNFTLDLTVPAGKSLSVAAKGMNTTITRNETEEDLTIHARVDHISVFPEDEMDSGASWVPRIAYSSFTAWDEVGNFLTSKVFLPSSLPEVPEKLDDPLTVPEKISRAVAFVADHLVTVPMDLPRALSSMRDPAAVLESGEGTELDMARLLHSIFTLQGLDPVVHLVSPEAGIPEVPGFSQFDRIFLAIYTKDRTYYIRPGHSLDEENRSTLLGSWYFTPGMSEPQVFRPDDDILVLDGTLTVREDEIMIEGQALLKGRFAGIASGGTSGIEDGLSAFLPTGTTLTSVNAMDVTDRTCRVEFEGIRSKGTVLRLVPELSSLDIPEPTYLERVLPMAFPRTGITVRWKIEGKNSAGEILLPEGSSLECPGIAIQTTVKDKEEYTARLEITKDSIEPLDYLGCRAALAAWDNMPNSSALFKGKKKP